MYALNIVVISQHMECVTHNLIRWSAWLFGYGGSINNLNGFPSLTHILRTSLKDEWENTSTKHTTFICSHNCINDKAV